MLTNDVSSTMDVPQVKACLKELENASNADRIVEVLEDLQKNFKPTEQLLRETKIGVAVNKLRSHSDSRVSALVKKLVGSWREQVQQQKAKQQKLKQQKEKSSNESSAPSAATAGSSSAPSTAGSSSTGESKIDPSKKRDAKSDGVNTDLYEDRTRNSCVQVTYNALVTESTFPPTKVLTAAKNVEAAVFIAEKGTTPGYRTKMRSLFMNLKDPKNPTLRTQVVLGKISGERLRTMKPHEMANDELKKQMEEIEKQNLFNAQSAQEQRATTDRFTCGKCKHKKVSYYQMQTRSADEPLTTFCTCENCGYRWKFS